MSNQTGVNIDALAETPLWLQVWGMKAPYIAFFALFLLLIILLMLLKDPASRRRKFLEATKYGYLGVSFIYVGLVLKAQPTTTNIVIMFNAMKELKFPLGLYMLEPFIFLSFIFIFLTMIVWGRGVFCGWLCPYGAMLELLNKLYKKIFPKVRQHLGKKPHRKLIYLKYAIFFVIIGVSFFSFILSEYLTEVEPFRTFVLKLAREWYFVLYFVVLTAGSVVVFRGFCRYMCPLGAALALPNFFTGLPLVKLKRYEFCNICKICTEDCLPQAIKADGVIDTRECLTCLECQMNYWDDDKCPVMIQEKRSGQAAQGGTG